MFFAGPREIIGITIFMNINDPDSNIKTDRMYPNRNILETKKYHSGVVNFYAVFKFFLLSATPMIFYLFIYLFLTDGISFHRSVQV